MSVIDESKRNRSRVASDELDELKENDGLDALFAQIDAGQLQLTGEGGFVPSSRNGATPKTVNSEVGEIDLDVPRDRVGSFEPRLMPKGSSHHTQDLTPSAND